MNITKNTLFILLFVASASGCGSSSTSASIPSNNNNTETAAPTSSETPDSVAITPSATTNSYELIINNGRGTMNNQDTEKSNTANVTTN